MWFLFSQHVLHITDVWDLDQGFVKIELCKSSILMVLYAVVGFDRNSSVVLFNDLLILFYFT